jgi:hypothetical protein
MAIFATLDTPSQLFGLWRVSWWLPDLEATIIFMTNLRAFTTFNDIVCTAFTCFMADLIALETQFFITIERIVSIFATEDAIELCRPPLIGTLSTHVAKLFAIATLYRGVMVRSEVPSFLLLHFLVVVVLVIVFCFFHNWLF